MLQPPLKQQLAVLIKDKETRKLLMNWSTLKNIDGTLEDIFDGGAYKELKDIYFEDDLDLALGLFTDDFTRFRRGGQSMTIIHLVILNLPSKVHYEDKNMLQLCVTPDPEKPQEMLPFWMIVQFARMVSLSRLKTEIFI